VVTTIKVTVELAQKIGPKLGNTSFKAISSNALDPYV
jgi:hypothetical protein